MTILKYLVIIVLSCFLLTTAQAEQSQSQIEQVRLITAQQLAQQPTNRLLRFRYAKASYQLANQDVAKYHLRVMMRTSQSEKELKQLTAAYATVTADSLWSFGMNLSILPSTNINKVSSNKFFDTSSGRFYIGDGGVEKSGAGIKIGSRLSYQSILPNSVFLTSGFEINRSQYPASRLNNFDASVSLKFEKRYVAGVRQVTPYIQRHLYDASPTTNADSFRYGIKFSNEHYLTSNSSVTGTFSAEYREHDNLSNLNGDFYNTSLSYQGELSKATELALNIRLTHNYPKTEHLKYRGVSLEGVLTRRIGALGIAGINSNLGMRQYQGEFPFLWKTREDRSASIGTSFKALKVEIFDVSPKLSCQIQQNWSNVALYDFKSTDCAIVFEKNF